MERMHRYPMRYLLPAALVLLTTVVCTLVYFTSQRAAVRQIEVNGVEALRVELGELQGIVQLLLRTGEVEGANAAVASLAATLGLEGLWLTDAVGTVRASIDSTAVGQHWSTLNRFVHRESIEELAIGADTTVRLTDARRKVLGHAPVCTANPPQGFGPSHCGSLIIVSTLEPDIAATLSSLRAKVLSTGALILGATLILLRFAHLALSRRAHRLVTTDLTARADMEGRDELADLATAFNSLLDRVAEGQTTLAQNEARLRDFSDCAADTFWEMGPDLRFTYAAGRFPETMGIEPGFLIGKKHEELHGQRPEDAEKWQSHFEDIAAHRPFTDFEVAWNHRDGSVRRLQLTAKPIFGENGEFQGYRGCGRDVTEQRRVHAISAQLGGIVEDSLNEIYVFDADTLKFKLINRGGRENLQYSDEELREKTPVDIKPEFTWTDFCALIQPLRAGKQAQLVFETVHRRKDGSTYDVEIHLQLMHTETQSVFVAVVLDITERKRAQKALKESHETLEVRVQERTAELAHTNRVLRAQVKERERAEARFRGLVEAAPDAMVIIDEDGAIELVNARTEALFGYTREELVGQPVELLVPASLRGKHEINRKHFARTPQTRSMGLGLELNALTKEGHELPVEISLSPLRGENGVLTSAAVRDTSERRRHEHAIQAAREEAERADSAKSRFLASASHDLRQPLQSLGIYLEILQREVGEGNARNIIDEMDRSLGTMGALLNALLDISKLEAKIVTPELTHFLIQDLLDRVSADATPQAQNRNLSIRFVPSSLAVHTDPTLLEQIVRNFVFNAIRYTESGRVVVGCRRLGKNLRIEVWDTGIGIAHDALESIFDEFVQLHNDARHRKKGLGLGLAIAHRTADLLGHALEVRSELGKGSMFSVEVPIGRLSPKAHPPRLETGADTPGAAIFYIEDDTDIAHATGLLLELSGYDVVTADSAEAALARLEETQFRPDLLLCDYRLPNSVTGVELIKSIRATLGDHHIPAIINTGDTSPARLKDTASITCEVLYKPVKGRELISTIQRLLALRTRPVQAQPAVE